MRLLLVAAALLAACAAPSRSVRSADIPDSAPSVDIPDSVPSELPDAGPPPAEDAAATDASAERATRKRYLWIAVGESGMSGRGKLGDVATVFPGYPGADLWIMRGGLAWEPLAEPTGDGAPGVGPAGFFAAVWGEACGAEVGLINTGLGGRRSYEWLPDHAGGLYRKTVDRARAALASEDVDVELAGFLHFDGLNDAAEAVEPHWNENWTAVEAALRAELDAPDVPWLYANIDGAPVAYQQTAAVLDQQRGWQSDARIMVDLPPGPWLDGSHLATAGSYALAERFLGAWLERVGCN